MMINAAMTNPTIRPIFYYPYAAHYPSLTSYPSGQELTQYYIVSFINIILLSSNI